VVPGHRYRFLVNNGEQHAHVLAGPHAGVELVTDVPVPSDGVLDVPAGAVRVLRTEQA
jgi:hypothetical protein